MQNPSGVLFSLALFILTCVIGCIDDTPRKFRDAEPITCYENQIRIDYQDGSVDTITIDVYERPDNIKVENGNLSYWKPSKGEGSAFVAAYVVNVASYVKSFKIVSSEIKTKTKE